MRSTSQGSLSLLLAAGLLLLFFGGPRKKRNTRSLTPLLKLTDVFLFLRNRNRATSVSLRSYTEPDLSYDRFLVRDFWRSLETGLCGSNPFFVAPKQYRNFFLLGAGKDLLQVLVLAS